MRVSKGEYKMLKFESAHIIETPSGKYTITGRVPHFLCYEMIDGSEMTEEIFVMIKSFE